MIFSSIMVSISQTSYTRTNIKERFSYYHSTIYADTVSIKKPLIVNIDGIGFLTPKDDLDPEKHKKILQSSNTCIVFCIFRKPYLLGDYDIPLMGLKSSTMDQLYDSNIYVPISPKFKFVGKIKGCEVYESEEPIIRFAVFLVQINYLNDLLNPFIEWEGKPGKVRKRIIKSSYPAIEYIKVAMPTM